jgi:hypothetical protein
VKARLAGLFYPDGTVRDPAIIAAVMGFCRNRDLNTIIKTLPNREDHTEKALRAIEAALKSVTCAATVQQSTAPFTDSGTGTVQDMSSLSIETTMTQTLITFLDVPQKSTARLRPAETVSRLNGGCPASCVPRILIRAPVINVRNRGAAYQNRHPTSILLALSC